MKEGVDVSVKHYVCLWSLGAEQRQPVCLSFLTTYYSSLPCRGVSLSRSLTLCITGHCCPPDGGKLSGLGLD